LKACEYSKYLSAYVDTRLDDNMERMIKMHISHCTACNKELDQLHISHCTACNKELDQLRLIRQLCLGLTEEEIPSDLHPRIMNKVQNEKRTTRGKAYIKLITACATVIVLLFLMGRTAPMLNGSNIGNSKQIIQEYEDIVMIDPTADARSAEDMEMQDSAVKDDTKPYNLYLILKYGTGTALSLFVFFLLIRNVRFKKCKK
jgi:hypothetical protein